MSEISPTPLEEVHPPGDDANAAEDLLPAAARRRQELDFFFSIAYEELTRLAASVKHSFPGSPLSPATVVHEVWIRLNKSCGMSRESMLSFKCMAVIAMRQVLVEAARRADANKRGGDALFVTFDESLAVSAARHVIDLDHALIDLATLDPRKASIVEMHVFGMTIAETAEALQVATATVERDWRLAKAWLASQLHRQR